MNKEITIQTLPQEANTEEIMRSQEVLTFFLFTVCLTKQNSLEY